MSLYYKLFGVETTRDKLIREDKEYKSRKADENLLSAKGWKSFVEDCTDLVGFKDGRFEYAQKFLDHYNIKYIINKVNSTVLNVEYGCERYKKSTPVEAIFIRKDNYSVVERAFNIWYKSYTKKREKEYQDNLNIQALKLLKSK